MVLNWAPHNEQPNPVAHTGAAHATQGTERGGTAGARASPMPPVYSATYPRRRSMMKQRHPRGSSVSSATPLAVNSGNLEAIADDEGNEQTEPE